MFQLVREGDKRLRKIKGSEKEAGLMDLYVLIGLNNCRS